MTKVVPGSWFALLRYLQRSDLDRAKEVMLRCCAEYTTPAGWLRVGSICYKLGDLEDAEDALQVRAEPSSRRSSERSLTRGRSGFVP
jgi:hypothetical protein